ncbi:UDP-N-acetylglucosamine 2-epimerase (non-hydrolysing) [Rhizobiales bacterium GAS188]|nr:UDP-N-acetylglucosamine 2-epimerase (non-hydrolysing) [Rhizobiales bacterium GAS188]
MHLYNIDCIVGARPNFVKIAPIMRALSCRNGMKLRLIHTGQHYDIAMSAVFFDDLAIPSPDINLEVGSGTHTEQTARIMMALEPVFVAQRPDLVLVVGDVNSTMAASLAAAKLNIPVAHVEAGLRSFDRTMPEEINRLVTDRLSDLLLATEPSAVDNLVKEGIAAGRIHFVGNVMIDSLHACLDRAVPARGTLVEMGASAEFITAATGRGFGFVTLHRPSNVDDPSKLAALLKALIRISRDLCLIFPLHPRTRAVISAAHLGGLLERGALFATPPLSYLRALGFMRDARLVITDSGGVQEETTALGVPCLTVRENTERPITVQEGTNTLVGSSPDALIAAAEHSLRSRVGKGKIPALWDGRAAIRIADCIEAFLRMRSAG